MYDVMVENTNKHTPFSGITHAFKQTENYVAMKICSNLVLVLGILKTSENGSIVSFATSVNRVVNKASVIGWMGLIQNTCTVIN